MASMYEDIPSHQNTPACRAVAEVLSFEIGNDPARKVTPDSELAALGVDSVMRADIWGVLERSSSTRISEEAIQSAIYVRDIDDAMRQ